MITHEEILEKMKSQILQEENFEIRVNRVYEYLKFCEAFVMLVKSGIEDALIGIDNGIHKDDQEAGQER